MKVLIADDEAVARAYLNRMLTRMGYETVVAEDGNDALRQFLEQRPEFLITDWMMPGMDGLTLVKTIRAFAETDYTYIVMVSAREDKSDILAGMEAGVDEFLSKPLDYENLHARMRVGKRILTLQANLQRRIKEIEEAQAHVKKLQGFLPICAYCKNVRNEADLWQAVEHYISEYEADVKFSHSICPDCFEKHVKPMQDEFFASREPA